MGGEPQAPRRPEALSSSSGSSACFPPLAHLEGGGGVWGGQRAPRAADGKSVPLSGRHGLGDVWVPSEPGGRVEKLSVP